MMRCDARVGAYRSAWRSLFGPFLTNNRFGLSSKAPGLAPEVGIAFSL